MKKFISFVLVIVLSLSLAVNALAVESAGNSSNDIMTLEEFGFTAVEIAQVPDIGYLAELVRTNPDAIERTETITSLNELNTIRAIVASTDETLLQAGYAQEEIDCARAVANDFATMSGAEIAEKYQRSGLNVAQISNYLAGGMMRATIPLTELKVTLTKYTNSGSGAKPVHYTIIGSFKWISHPFLYFSFPDHVAFGWGGNLVRTATAATITYENGATSPATITEPVINAGLKVEFPYVITPGLINYRVDNGAVAFQLYQNSATGNDTKVLFAYAYKKLTPAVGIGISATGPSVNFSFSSGYDYSEQVSVIITY